MPESDCAESSSHTRLSGAGFWVRFAATWIDLTIVCLAVIAAVAVFAKGGHYLPFELTFVGAIIVYSVLLIGAKGRTAGKAWCGLEVRSVADERIGFPRALLRECVGKVISTAFLFLGFLWILPSRRNCAWHDWIARTVVIRDKSSRRGAQVALFAALMSCACAIGLYAWGLTRLYGLVREMNPTSVDTVPYLKRHPDSTKEVSFVGEVERQNIHKWLDSNSRDPVEYVVTKAREHQVIIFGESHEKQQELQFLNRVISDLYRQADVMCIAMEVCLAEDNDEIQRLVTAPTFDRDLALRIARHQPWRMWGWQEYWDVFETVWALNRSIPSGEKKVRVVGIDMPMDWQSLAMVGAEDNPAANCPWWEKLRIFRAVGSLPRVLARDAYFVKQVEQEIIEKEERGIVWVGRNHSAPHCPQIGSGGRGMNRMGFILHQKHHQKVFQIRLHGLDIPASAVDSAYSGPGPLMADFLEGIILERKDYPLAFNVEGSPFSVLRDSGAMEYHFERRLTLADLASGFIFLAKRSDLKTCHWLPGFVSEEMFVANKPFYQAFGRKAGLQLETAEQVNDFFSKAAEW